MLKMIAEMAVLSKSLFSVAPYLTFGSEIFPLALAWKWKIVHFENSISNNATQHKVDCVLLKNVWLPDIF